MQNLKNDIKNGVFAPIYIFCGEEKFLIEHYTKEIIKNLTDEDTNEFNLLQISNSLPDEAEIDAFVSSYPFMSDKKVLVIEDTKIFKSITESQKEYFLDLASNMPEYLVVVFCETEINKKSALYKEIAKKYRVCEFNFQDIPTLATWLVNLFKNFGREIAKEDALYMSEIAGPSMLALKSEAQKLVSFCETEIDRASIDTLVTRNIENRVFAMIDDIVMQNADGAAKKFKDLKALNEEPIKIISIMFNKFATFHKLYLLKDRSIGEICSLCGLWEKHAKNNLNQAKKLGVRKIATVMKKCRDADFAIKNGSLDKWLAIELVIAEALIQE